MMESADVGFRDNPSSVVLGNLIGWPDRSATAHEHPALSRAKVASAVRQSRRGGQHRSESHPSLSARWGAGSIVGIDLSVPAADGIIFAFALWGGSQLIYALVQLAVAFRYRSLVPFCDLLLILETLLRMLVGPMKPVHCAHTPPDQIILPLAVLMLGLCLLRPIGRVSKLLSS